MDYFYFLIYLSIWYGNNRRGEMVEILILCTHGISDVVGSEINSNRRLFSNHGKGVLFIFIDYILCFFF